jgi:hypothetical protein
MPKLINPQKLPKQRRPLTQESWQILYDIDSLIAADPAKAAQMEIKTLRATLKKVPFFQRGADWTERIVQCYCVKLMKANRCSSLMREIRKIRTRDGEELKFEAFRARIAIATQGNELGPHGFGKPLKTLDKPALAAELTTTFELLNQLGYSAFINSGTLLGAFREKTFIGHDDDIDLAVIIEHSRYVDIIKAMFELKGQLEASGRLAKPVALSNGTPILKIELDTGVVVDIFPCWIRDGQVYVWPHTFGELATDDLLPLRKLELEGIEFDAPKNPEKMLVLNYGVDWHTPDSTFRFHWKTARKKFKGLKRSYKIQKFLNRY